MTKNKIESCKEYLSEDDYLYLIEYIDNIKNNILNDKMIILLGPGATGKSTLIGDIRVSLDEYGYQCYKLPILDLHFCCLDDVKLATFDGIDDYLEEEYEDNSKMITKNIINMIKNKLSLIVPANEYNKIDPEIIEYSRIINMTHVFLSPRKEYG